MCAREHALCGLAAVGRRTLGSAAEARDPPRACSKADKTEPLATDTVELGGALSPHGVAHSVTPRPRDADPERTASGGRAPEVPLPGGLSQEAQSASRWPIIKAAAAVAPLWFLAQLCFNASLLLTSVTSNTILSSASSLFTFFLSVVLLGESFALTKLVAVLLTVIGAPSRLARNCPPHRPTRCARGREQASQCGSYMPCIRQARVALAAH